MSKVYGYCRVALASEEEIREQTRMIAEYCKDNNLMVDGYFCDNGVSGFDIGEEFKQLLGELKNGDTVIMKDFARLSRSNARALAFMRQFDDMGVKILYVNGNDVDTSSISKWIEERLVRQQ